MPQDIASLNLTLLCTSMAAALVAGTLLAIEFFGSPKLAKQAPGGFAVVLAGMGLLALGLPGGVWIASGCIGLMMLLLAAWPIGCEGVRRQLLRLVTPKIVWAFVLGGSMIASRYLAAHVLHSLDREPPPQVLDL